MISPETLFLLRRVDTPTLCNAIEVVEGRRGFARFTSGTVLESDPGAGAICGRVRTAAIAAADPPDAPADEVRARRMADYRHMADGPRPAVAVVEDHDCAAAMGAFWGEINATVHRGLGLSGAITNGVMRDLGDLPQGFSIIAGSVGPSHGFTHVRSIGAPVTVFGLRVETGDLLHADRHGGVVIPDAYLPEIAAAVEKLFRTERLILEAARI